MIKESVHNAGRIKDKGGGNRKGVKIKNSLIAIISLSVISIAMAVGLGVGLEKKEKPYEYKLQLLHFSDIDGGGEITKNIKPFAAMAKKFSNDIKNTLFVGSGDLWIAGPEYQITDTKSKELSDLFGPNMPGQAHIAWANAVGMQVSTLGNHEFDKGPGAIAELIRKKTKNGKTWEGANWPYLVTNLDFSALTGFDKDKKPKDFEGLIAEDGKDISEIKGKIASYATTTIGGEKIGLIGAIYPDLQRITTLGDVKLKYGPGTNASSSFEDKLKDLASQIQEDVDALRKEGINKIVLMTHLQQFDNERKLATMLDGVDIIVGGGSNEVLTDENDVLRGVDTDKQHKSYPYITKSKTGETVMAVNVDGDYTYLGRLVIEFDSKGVIKEKTYDPNISGAYAATDAVYAAFRTDKESESKKREIKIADEIDTSLNKMRKNIFGYTNTYLNGERQYVRTEETNLGNLVIDSKVAYARHFVPNANPIIGIQNGGGIRGPIGLCVVPPGGTGDPECNPPKEDTINGEKIQKGAISELDIQTIMKFNNGIEVLHVTGTQLKQIFEDGLAKVKKGATEGSFPQVSNLKLEYYIDGDVNSKVKTLTIIDANPNTNGNQEEKIVENGAVVTAAASKEYGLVTPSWLSALGKEHDGYKTLGSIPATKRTQLEGDAYNAYTPILGEKGKEQDAFAWYLKQHYSTPTKAYNINDDKRTTNGISVSYPDKRIKILHKS